MVRRRRLGRVALRLPQALASAGTVPLLFVVARPVFGPRRALAGAIALALNPFHIWYAQEVRNYAFLVLFTVLALGAIQKLEEAGRLRSIPTLAFAWIGGLLFNLELPLPHHLLGHLGDRAHARAARAAGGARGGRGDHAPGDDPLGRRILSTARLAIVPAPPRIGSVRGEVAGRGDRAGARRSVRRVRMVGRIQPGAVRAGASPEPVRAGAGAPPVRHRGDRPLFRRPRCRGALVLDEGGWPPASLAARPAHSAPARVPGGLPEREGFQPPIRVGRPARLRDVARRRRGVLNSFPLLFV